MRVIKFRCWDKYHKCFLKENGEITTDVMHLIDGASENEKYVFMQYTGVNDKNGNEIYELDIVRYLEKVDMGNSCYDDDLMTIEWSESEYCWKARSICSPFNVLQGQDLKDSFEIIGNIYENPEMKSNKK